MRAVAILLALLAACSGDVVEGESPDAGTVEVDASPPDAPPAGELRGVWITRFAYSWRAGLEAIIDRAADAGFNAVFVQIRGNGDAYYASTIEPWSERLTGVLGRDPGWDPLQVAIDRAHARGIELHAYFNVFSAWTAASPVPIAEGPRQHALRDHPEWLAVDSTGTNRDGEYRWFAPGNPAVRAHTVAVARDLLTRYDVDGLHLDRIRTPGPDYSRDAVTEAAYDAAVAADPDLTWADFMRAQVSTMVGDLYALIAEVKPQVRLSASVWGIYEPLPGCSTSQGFGNYYQDSLGWLDAEIIDALVPMIYWPIEPGACTDWRTLLDGFMDGRADRHIWAGMHALDDDAWDFAQVSGRIDEARAQAAHGVVVFASTYLDADQARWDAFVGDSTTPGPFAQPIATPWMDWKP
jgi:uncharacterized lipoprotein YddW (UPF0748 family)